MNSQLQLLLLNSQVDVGLPKCYSIPRCRGEEKKHLHHLIEIPGQYRLKVNMEHSDDRVIQMIRYAAAEVVNEPDHPVHLSKLGIKVNTPKYSGDSSLAVFESFMTDLLRLLKTYQLFKPDYDKTHIRILGTGLEGAAKEWFNHTVDTNDIHSPQWT